MKRAITAVLASSIAAAALAGPCAEFIGSQATLPQDQGWELVVTRPDSVDVVSLGGILYLSTLPFATRGCGVPTVESQTCYWQIFTEPFDFDDGVVFEADVQVVDTQYVTDPCTTAPRAAFVITLADSSGHAFGLSFADTFVELFRDWDYAVDPPNTTFHPFVTTGAFHHYRVEVVGDEVVVSIDGAYAFAQYGYGEPSFPHPNTVLIGDNSEFGNTSVRIANFSVTSHPCPGSNGDSCENAIVLPPAPHSGEFDNTGNPPPTVLPTCIDPAIGSNNEQWFRLPPPDEPAIYRVRVDEIDDINALVTAHYGSCSSQFELACVAAEDGVAELEFYAYPGNTLSVRVATLGMSSPGGRYTLSTVQIPPDYDTCDEAYEITAVPFSGEFNNRINRPSLPKGSCNAASSTMMQNAQWARFIPPSTGEYRLDLATDSSAYDMIASLYTGTCGALTEIACGDEPEPIAVTFDAVAGVPVFIETGDWGTIPGGGDYTLSLTRTSGCNAADLNADGLLNLDDIAAFATAFVADDLAADLDNNAILNLDDIAAFAAAFLAGCP